MRNENKSMRRVWGLMTLLLLLITPIIRGQNLNTFGSNAIPNQTVEPKIDFMGGLEGQVDMTTGVYGVSQKLGTVSTVCGISYDLMMSYSSKVRIGMEEPNIKGLPFGEGWSLDIPRISALNESYKKFDNTEYEQYEQIWDVAPPRTGAAPPAYTNTMMSEADYLNEGRPMFTVTDITIPGVCSGRFVYKGTNTDLGVEYAGVGGRVFVPLHFEKYVEAILIPGQEGSVPLAATDPYWLVITDDGTVYEFRKAHAVLISGPNQRGESDYIFTSPTGSLYNKFQFNYLPKKSYDSWYCTKIKHKRDIKCTFDFHYSTYGHFDEYYSHTQQRQRIAGYLHTPASAYTGPGENDMWKDIYLDSITTTIQRLEINYNDALKSQISNIQNTELVRIDNSENLYYKQKVTITGKGKRMLHVKSPLGMWCNTGESLDLGTNLISNPYINPGYNNYLNQLVTAPQSYIQSDADPVLGVKDDVQQGLAYNAGVYMSPEIPISSLVAGDMYVLEYFVPTPGGVDALLDVNIVANEKNILNYENHDLGPIYGAQAVDSRCFGAKWSKSIYNTFSSGIKDFVNVYNQSANDYKHYFTMPSLATADHDMIQIRIGPANSDMQMNWGLSSTTQQDMYAKMLYYNNPSDYYKLGLPGFTEYKDQPYGRYSRIPQNFGIGLPWYALIGYYGFYSPTPAPNGTFASLPYWYDAGITHSNNCANATVPSKPILPYNYEIPYQLYRLVKVPLMAGAVTVRSKLDLAHHLEKITMEYEVTAKPRNVSYIDAKYQNGTFYSKNVTGDINYILLKKVNFLGNSTSVKYTNTFAYTDMYINSTPNLYNSSTNTTYYGNLSRNGIPRSGSFPVLTEYKNFLGKKTNLSYYLPYKKDITTYGGIGWSGYTSIEFGTLTTESISPVVLVVTTQDYSLWRETIGNYCNLPERVYRNAVCDIYFRTKSSQTNTGTGVEKYNYTYGADNGAVVSMRMLPEVLKGKDGSPNTVMGLAITNKTMKVDGPFVDGSSLGSAEYTFFTDFEKFGKVETKAVKDKNGSLVMEQKFTYKIVDDYYNPKNKTSFDDPVVYDKVLSNYSRQQYAGFFDDYSTMNDFYKTDDTYFKPKFVGLERATTKEYYAVGSVESYEEYQYYLNLEIPNNGMFGCYQVKTKTFHHPSLSSDIVTTYKYLYHVIGNSAELAKSRQVGLVTQETTTGEIKKDRRYEYINVFSLPHFALEKSFGRKTVSDVELLYDRVFAYNNFYYPEKYSVDKDLWQTEVIYNGTSGLLEEVKYPVASGIPFRKLKYHFNDISRKVEWSEGVDGLRNKIDYYDEFYRPGYAKFMTSTAKPSGKTALNTVYGLYGGTGGENTITQTPEIPDGGYALKSTTNFNAAGKTTYGTKGDYLTFSNSYDEAGRLKFSRAPGARALTSYKYLEMPVTRLSTSKNMEWGNEVGVKLGAVNGLVYIEMTDEDGKKTREYKDGLGRVKIVSNFDDYGVERQTTYAYNDCGEVSSITQPTGETATFEYDNECRLIRKRKFGETADHVYSYYPVATPTYPVVDPNSPPSNPNHPRLDMIWMHTYPNGDKDIFDYTIPFREMKSVTRVHGGVSTMIRRLTYGTGTLMQDKVVMDEQWVETAPGVYTAIKTEVITNDDFGRPTKIKTTNLNGSVDEVTYIYDGLDNILKATRKHIQPSLQILNIVTDNFYDLHAFRTGSKMTIGSTDSKVINGLQYDAYGALIKRNIGQYGSGFLQKQDYTYNKRGWLTNINSFNECQNTIEPPVYGKEVTPIKKTQVDVITKKSDVLLGKQTLMKVELTTKMLVGATPVYSAMAPESTVLFDKGETLTTSGTDTARVIYYGEMDEWTVAGQLAQLITTKTPTNTIDYYNPSSKMDTSTYLQNKIKDAVVTLKDKAAPCNAGLKNGDLFAQELRYQNPHTSYPGYQSYYNGNISQNRWMSVGDQYIRSYSYTYNSTNQMLNGLYREKGLQANDVPVSSRSGMYDELVQYYHNSDYLGNVGNIKRIERYGPLTTGGSRNQIDYLDFAYTGGYKLGTVTESSSFTNGFKKSTQYSYDAAGNVTGDTRALVSAAYSAENQPVSVTTDVGSIFNFYAPNGEKLGYKCTKGGVTTYHYYVGGIEYEGTTIKHINHEEGRYVVSSITNGEPVGRWEYVLRDHQGNARIHFSDVNGDGVVANTEGPLVQEIYQKYGYYPFGMQYEYEMSNTPNPLDNIDPRMRYRYTGYEDLKDLGMEVFDANARLYNAYIGRFLGADLLSTDYSQWNAYTYCFNNPILIVDPTGMGGNEYLQYKNDKGELVSEFVSDKGGNIYDIIHTIHGKIPSKDAYITTEIKYNDNFGDRIAPGVWMAGKEKGLEDYDFSDFIPSKGAVKGVLKAGAFFFVKKVGKKVGKSILKEGLEKVVKEGVEEGLEIASKTGTNAFKHSYKYADRVRVRGVQDPVSHNFPYSFDDAILSTNPILKNNGYKIFQQSGTMNGKNGVFEIGLTKDGIIDHRFFRPIIIARQ